jgi:hypothetical protein
MVWSINVAPTPGAHLELRSWIRGAPKRGTEAGLRRPGVGTAYGHNWAAEASSHKQWPSVLHMRRATLWLNLVAHSALPAGTL